MVRFRFHGAALVRATAIAAGLALTTQSCAPSAELDLEHPSVSPDAEPNDDALDPLAPENDGEDVIVPTRADASESAPDADAPEDAALSDTSPILDSPVAPRDASRPPRMCVGSASGQSSIWTCTADRRARQRCVDASVDTESCAHGCVIQPSGTNDYCASAASPTGLPACARQALLRWGLHAHASDHLRCAGVPASRISQTIGSAAASAGTHAQDGTFAGEPYSAATDIRTRGLTNDQIRALLTRLANQGFAAWYRLPGSDGWPASEAPHIHAIYVGCAMKVALRAQVSDWLMGRNGLRSHSVYRFYSWSDAQLTVIRAVFSRHN